MPNEAPNPSDAVQQPPVQGQEQGQAKGQEQGQQDPPKPETLDLTPLGETYKGKSLPKPIFEKITTLKPEEVAYLEKLDLADRMQYDSDKKVWVAGQNSKMEKAALQTKEAEQRTAEAKEAQQKYLGRLDEMEKIFGNSAFYHLQTDPELSAQAKIFKDLLDDGKVDQAGYDQLMNPLLASAKRKIEDMRAAEIKETEDFRKAITEVASAELVGKHTILPDMAEGLVLGLSSRQSISPADAAKEFNEWLSQRDQVVAERSVQAYLAKSKVAPEPLPAAAPLNTPKPKNYSGDELLQQQLDYEAQRRSK